MKVTGAMVNPTRDSVDEPGWIEVFHSVRKAELRVTIDDLAPTLIVKYLSRA
jgi:hypothetical protein